VSLSSLFYVDCCTADATWAIAELTLPTQTWLFEQNALCTYFVGTYGRSLKHSTL
jgi:hypothetical protein